MWGDRDQAFKEPQRRRWERAFPNHKTVILQGASHYIQEDAPEQARSAARGKDVMVMGGANLAQRYIAARLLDELRELAWSPKSAQDFA